MRRRTKILLIALGTLAVLSVTLAWRIHTWGNPLPLAYRLVSILPGNPGGDRSWIYQRTSDHRRVIASDTDEDGTIDSVLVEGSDIASFNRPAADPDNRWLVICLDGIPYEEILALWEEGHFREFFRPVPLISPFPSESEIAMTESLHAGPVPGYEHGYFDREANQLKGGILQTLQEVDIPYLRMLDYDMGGLFKGAAYLLPGKSYQADLGRFRKRFLASDEKIYLAHIASIDSLIHIIQREEIRALLIAAEALLRELYYDAGGKLRITVYADHGNSLALSKRVPLEKHLAANGWSKNGTLDKPRDVVIPTYGLIAFSAVYTAPENIPELAAMLGQVEGIDIAVYRKENGMVIESARGRAEMLWNGDATSFRYVTETGDPLALNPVLENLRKEGKADREGWVSNEDLFLATLDHAYPDPGYRLHWAAINHVTNPADILISYAPGYFYGRSLFDKFVTLYSTHGSFDRMQTLGFAMSTDGPLPRTIRSKELLPADIAERKKAAKP